ncbi:MULTISPECIES: hypothetical protein [unclassified Brevibacterium]|uniref:hypothetical protein n=1 Tax=unclassified Brevibacterium TaxID=2614124 RepID=UPI001867F4A3|nr:MULTISPECIES: hypothetical protein [unclassified Brevibacterium]
MNDNNSSGRVVLITGTGIGKELVTRFLTNKDTVIATDVSPEALQGLFRSPHSST